MASSHAETFGHKGRHDVHFIIIGDSAERVALFYVLLEKKVAICRAALNDDCVG